MNKIKKIMDDKNQSYWHVTGTVYKESDVDNLYKAFIKIFLL